ncbi:hypothetical protein IWW50_001833 [Coemansia erecta]|nr:hypothetical protein IWW50_001833 [Coemansia erecta]
MKHAWDGYRSHAFGKDELQPLTQTGNTRWGGWAITLLDSLDTLYLMGLRDEYNEAKDHVRGIDFTKSPRGFQIQVFEMVIRALGGLLGAYELDHDPVLLHKAAEVAQTLARAFETPTGLPHGILDLNDPARPASPTVSLAEAGTMQLEFKALSRATGERRYWEMAERVSDALDAGNRTRGALFPMYVHVESGRYEGGSDYTVGAHADSFYEYLLKQYIMHGEPKYRERYVASVEAVVESLVGRTQGGLAFVGRRPGDGGRLVAEMEHLACFYPGLLALGARVLDRPQDLRVAEELARTCYAMYQTTPTGLSPEIAYFTPGTPDILPTDPRYILRPETIESLFILYRITGDRKYQDWGWRIFESIERFTRVEHGYAAVVDVMKTNMTGNREDSMESFFLAETLKYLYLLFSPTNVLSLDEYVLSTEAHPFRIMK